MVLKDCNTLKEAMLEVEKMINSFEKYEDNNKNYRNKNFNNNNNYLYL